MIGTVALTMIKVADARLGKTERIQDSAGQALVYSSRARTLLDAIYDWSRFGSLPRGFDWIRQDIASGRINATELVRITLRYGNQGTARRMGALLESLGTEDSLLAKLSRMLKSATSLIPFDPSQAKR